jgi:Fic family protein
VRLLQNVQTDTHRLGIFRDYQNFIGQSLDPAQARFVPPPVEDMDGSLRDFESYLHSGNRYPPLVRLALIHYQFETIHPFGDGNGRIGRLIIPLLMIKWGLLPSPLLYLSGYLEQHRQDYYDRLMAVRQSGAWLEWIEFFLKGVEVQSHDAKKRSIQLQSLQQTWLGLAISRDMPANVIKLINLLFENPFLTVPRVQALLDNVTYHTAKSNIDKLVDLKIIEPFSGKVYDKKFIASKVLEIVS